jgi:hypothetical protein
MIERVTAKGWRGIYITGKPVIARRPQADVAISTGNSVFMNLVRYEIATPR